MTKQKRPDVIVVCGLGRCGSSLTMQMLNAGGVPCNGEFPTFEHHMGSLGGNEPYWLSTQNGRATKVLTPHHYPFINGQYKFIWVDRDPFEQAKSTAKFTHFILNKSHQMNFDVSGKMIMKLFDAYEPDKARSMKQLNKYGEVLEITFENIIMFPKTVVTLLAAYLEMDLDTYAMANIVQFRPIQCGPDMQLEVNLIKESEVH